LKGIRTVVPRHLFHDIYFRQLFQHTYLLTFVTGHLFRDRYFATLVPETYVPATELSRHIFRDTCSRDKCFATDISRHLFQRQMFRDRYFATLVPAPDVSRQIFRVTCYSNFFPLNKFDRQAKQRFNFLQQKFCYKKLHRCLACLSNLLRGKKFE
jgi:hypothetical protein